MFFSRPRRPVVVAAAALAYGAVLLTLEIRGPGWAFELVYAVAIVALVAYNFRRRGISRSLGRAARQRERDFYAARRDGASGPEAWISSGHAHAAARRRRRRG